MSFQLPKLSYGYDALEPFYDKQTVEIHYSKHHQTYTDKLNKALEDAAVNETCIEKILKNPTALPEKFRTPIMNHGGGYFNHNFFWESMTPSKGKGPDGDLAQALTQTFGSLEKFQETFSAKALNHFGSGWAWLVLNNGKLEVTDTHDQVSPITLSQVPLLTIDVWEHAYYLKYKNVRAEWIKAFWSIIHWEKVAQRYQAAKITAAA